MTILSHAEWKKAYGRMRDIADRISQMRNDRARKLCAEAGLDPGLLGIHPYNAMCGFNSGHPWEGIDYSKVRACIRMLDLQFEPYRILDKWLARVHTR